ncbi:progestin and adipoQ receptor family member 4 [Daktulosphaira vitifoliae]|uniref:progestin and adipoQ receptor family member 4 n=1 Tax=Daktulosphaira vitifoliae TaxID=58002 RepID=UPI0021A99718|nr:progestin and adipoQ receptor family member 4 [Daktulosphaira vitifoliae]
MAVQHFTNSGVYFTCKKITMLCYRENLPEHLRFNPYIDQGYRPPMRPLQCFSSILTIHNETLNIYTHIIALILSISLIYTSPLREVKDLQFIKLCHVIATIIPWIGSIVYHTFMNVYGNKRYYNILLKADLICIWLAQYMGGIPVVSVTIYYLPSYTKVIIGVFYWAICIWGLYKVFKVNNFIKASRFYFFLPITIRMTSVILRSTSHGGGSQSALGYVVLADLSSVIGGIINASRWPEKYFPGNFDFVFNSHNIMHLLVLLAMYWMHQVNIQDILWLSSVQITRSNV